jgi:hypothetical protein
MTSTFPLSSSGLIEVWEKGAGQIPIERAITMLSLCLGEPAERLWELSIGERDARLLEVYEALFGPALEAFAECPSCGERLEYSVAAGSLAHGGPSPENALVLQTGSLALQLRLPDSRDLLAASCEATVPAAARLLAERCVLQPAQLTDSDVDRISERLAEADPRADTLLDLTCAACGHGWQVVLEVERFLWTRIASAGKRLLREVHLLAQAYGWSEADILGLSAYRRRFYLEMLGE